MHSYYDWVSSLCEKSVEFTEFQKGRTGYILLAEEDFYIDNTQCAMAQ